MKYALCLVLLPLLAYSAVVPEQAAKPAADPSEFLIKTHNEVVGNVMQQRMDRVMKQIKFRQAIMNAAAHDQQKDGLKFLCKPCKTVFQDVKQELEAVEKITEPILKEKVDAACDKYVGAVPFVDNACKKIGEEGLEDLVDWLEKEEDKIDPARTCLFLHLC